MVSKTAIFRVKTNESYVEKVNNRVLKGFVFTKRIPN